MASLPDLKAVYQAQNKANDLLVASRLAWVIGCSRCGILAAADNAAGMLAGHEFMELGWSAPGGKRPVCPDCSSLL